MIAKKKKGQPVVSEAPQQEEEKVVDLMEALKKSLKGSGGPSREKARSLPRSAWAEQGQAQGESEVQDPSQDHVTQARGVTPFCLDRPAPSGATCSGGLWAIVWISRCFEAAALECIRSASQR
ncbi:MAG: hypothetical protein HQ465_01705 [Rhodospirillales bacterium]|nr:hypothetical protein [Rhodospirillales bacterium]